MAQTGEGLWGRGLARTPAKERGSVLRILCSKKHSMREIRTSGLMSMGVETWLWWGIEPIRLTERAGAGIAFTYGARATPRLYQPLCHRKQPFYPIGEIFGLLTWVFIVMPVTY